MSKARFHPEHADDNLGIPDDAGPRAIERIHRLIRERDEARARADGLERLVKMYGLLDDGSPVERAEARGYERGVREAVAAGNETLRYSSAWITTRTAILALLEPVTLQKPEA